MVGLAQMVRASDCGPEGRRFDPDIPPQNRKKTLVGLFFILVGNNEENTDTGGYAKNNGDKNNEC